MANQKLLDGLVKTLALEKFEENLFRGQSEKTSWGRVFGGQVTVSYTHLTLPTT